MLTLVKFLEMAKKKKSPYANEPKAPEKKRADNPLVQNASLGNEKMPNKPFVPVPPAFGKPPIGGAHGFGHKSHQRHGHIRTSGVPQAHRLGYKAPKVNE